MSKRKRKKAYWRAMKRARGIDIFRLREHHPEEDPTARYWAAVGGTVHYGSDQEFLDDLRKTAVAHQQRSTT